MMGAAACAVGAVSGCRQESEPVAEKAEERRDVPLRIAMLGTDADAEAIRRGWAAVTDQPLDLSPIALSRAGSGSLIDAVAAAAKKSDLVIYPLSLVPELAHQEAIVSLSKSDVDQQVASAGKLLPAVGNGAARYAGDFFAVPLGALLPALLSAEEIGEVESWLEYDRMVDQQWGGKAAEPTASGWAADTFLRRVAGVPSWLFRREDLRPIVDSEPYVDALELMIRTNGRYQSKPRTPGQIWGGIQTGELSAGIGFPAGRQDSDVEVYVNDLPGEGKTSKVLLDPFTLVLSLSSNCRQSVVAKRFMGWMSGGEASDTVRRSVSGMTVVRGQSGRLAQSDDSDIGYKSYDDWLVRRLQTPVTLPTLQILRAGQYYQVLDQQVTRALQGIASAQEALNEVARQWQAITETVGTEKQLRAWQRAQGMRA